MVSELQKEVKFLRKATEQQSALIDQVRKVIYFVFNKRHDKQKFYF